MTACRAPAGQEQQHLIVDDQAPVRAGLRLILDAEPDLSVVGEAENGLESVRQAVQKQPDIVLMDIRMPVLDGIEATRLLLAESPATHVVILTTFDLDDYIVSAFRAGASGFLLKTAPSQQLIAAVRTIHAGDALLVPVHGMSAYLKADATRRACGIAERRLQ